MIDRPYFVRVSGLFLLAMTLGGGTMGCAQFNNPFVDKLAQAAPVTTPSVDGARAVTATPRLTQRAHERFEVSPHSGAVTHGPLRFEDPFEEHGSEDGKFAWNRWDYAQVFYWRGRFLANLLLWPGSAVKTPPWVVMESDGRSTLRATTNKRFYAPPNREADGFDAQRADPSSNTNADERISNDERSDSTAGQ